MNYIREKLTADDCLKVYPINTVFSDDSTLEGLSYMSNMEERHKVEEMVIDCVSELGYTMKFGENN
ncbi:hypothetical protein H0A36_02625 [Endozoicomonas sp. SM1973]|uniref:Uncharacterized protein n=1 Tax=Spartinivicinus marinus TaxID=2994442 RepID=A0A853I6P7_9GAMM|nr:hypothetical protein [Spartinivicinus marinus]MCX4029872.1 hypothetical protein [Spartinivicinus marinus]NYZ64885.1 hypothetical protein [Spartinivicinus marinus]